MLKMGIITGPGSGPTGKRIILAVLPVLLAALSIVTAGCSGQEATPADQPATPTPPEVKSSERFQFSGDSMEPTLHDGDKMKAFAVNRALKRGDIVAFFAPDGSGYTLIKRVVGLPNERIEVKDGNVLINGTILSEPYVMEPAAYSYAATVIPEGSYFILGDNRNHSSDSHNFGAVPIGNILYLVEME
jgi:signal peptidase I